MKRVVIPLIFVFIAAGAVAWPRSSRVVIAPADEPGQRLIVTGRVFDPDGHPVNGIAMHASQSDAQGRDRWQGWLRTAEDGSYVIETIKPGTVHIRIDFQGGGLPKQNGTISFDDRQPLPRDANGVLHGTHDFHLSA